jgi:hypothetical protein
MLRDGVMCYESHFKSLESLLFVSGVRYNTPHDNELEQVHIRMQHMRWSI